MKMNCVVVIDTQADFMWKQGALYTPKAHRLIGPIIRYLTRLMPEDVSHVIFTMDTHNKETYHTLEESKKYVLHCDPKTVGWGNVVPPEVIDKGIKVEYLYKNTIDMWDGSAITTEGFHAGNIIPETHKIVIFGVVTELCVKAAVRGFLERGYEVEVLSRFCQSLSNQHIDQLFADLVYTNLRIS